MPTKTVRFKNKSGDWRSKKLDRWEKAYQIQQKRSKRAVSIDNSRNANRFMNPANDKLSGKELRTYNSWVKNPARSDLVGIDTKTVGTSKTKIVTLESKDKKEVVNFRGEKFKPEILEANIQAYIKQQQELKEKNRLLRLQIRDNPKNVSFLTKRNLESNKRQIDLLGKLEVQDRERLNKIKGIQPKPKIKEAIDPRFELENKPKIDKKKIDGYESNQLQIRLNKKIRQAESSKELNEIIKEIRIKENKLTSSDHSRLFIFANEKSKSISYAEERDKPKSAMKTKPKQKSTTKGKTREQIREDSIIKVLLDKGLIKDKQEFNAKAYVDMNLSSVENRKDVLRKFGGTGKRKFTKEQDIKVPRKDAIEKFLSLPEKEREKDLKEQSKKVRNVPDLDWYNNPKKSDIQNIDTKNSNENKLRKELRGYKKTKTEINLKRFNQLDNKFNRTPKEEQEYNTLLRSFN